MWTDQRNNQEGGKASPRGWQLWKLLPQTWKGSVILSWELRRRQCCLVGWGPKREQWETCQALWSPLHISSLFRPTQVEGGKEAWRHSLEGSSSWDIGQGLEVWVGSYLQMYMKDCRSGGVPVALAVSFLDEHWLRGDFFLLSQRRKAFTKHCGPDVKGLETMAGDAIQWYSSCLTCTRSGLITSDEKKKTQN